jgi:glycosyltransferase involved in cell wall biosynthesis
MEDHDAPRAAPLLSVVICTCNRSERLSDCLEALARNAASFAEPWEVIVVDNRSTDRTATLLDAWIAAGRLPLIAVSEPRVGLSNARNAALRVARGRLIAFTDDDCLVEPDWLRALRDAFAASPTADAIGGWVGLHDDQDAAVSIRTRPDACWIGDVASALATLIGCNFSIRAAVLRQVGDFDERLGAGSPARSGEDLDLFHRLIRAGARLRYDPSITVRHAHGRRDPTEVRRGYLIGRGAYYGKHILRGDAVVLRQAAREISAMVRARHGQGIRLLARGVWLRLAHRQKLE